MHLASVLGVVAAVTAAVVGLLTWEALALSLSAAALAVATVAIVLAHEAFDRTDAFQSVQAERISALEPTDDED